MTLSIPTQVEAEVVVGCFALVSTLLTAAISWINNHGITAQRNHLLEEANTRLAFWDQWLKIVKQLPEPVDEMEIGKVKQDMLSLAHFIEASSRSVQAEIVVQGTECTELRDKVERLSTWRTTLLLYRPARSLAWLPRLFFYMGVLSIAQYAVVRFVHWHDHHIRTGFEVEGILLAGTMLFRVLSELLERPVLGQLFYRMAHPNAPISSEESESA